MPPLRLRLSTEPPALGRHSSASNRARAAGRRLLRARQQAAADAPTALHHDPPDAQKLLVIIAADGDADALVPAMVAQGYTATKIGSTGGFLRRGNTTLLIGVPASAVDAVIELVRAYCPARSEILTVGALPLAGDAPYLGRPVEVRVGGAVVFVLNIERFERV